MSWPPYRRRVNTIEAKAEAKKQKAEVKKQKTDENKKLQTLGQEWAKAGAVACPGVQWEVRGATQSVTYVVEDGVIHYQDHRSVKYSTPLVAPVDA